MKNVFRNMGIEPEKFSSEYYDQENENVNMYVYLSVYRQVVMHIYNIVYIYVLPY